MSYNEFYVQDPPEDAVVTMCGHVFCYECVSEYLTGDDNICPATGCKEQIGSDVTFSKTTLRRSISDDLAGTSNDFQFVDKSIVMQKNYSSSKIKALLKILKDNLKQDGQEVVDDSDSDFEIDVEVVKHTTRFSSAPEGPIKTIVFSQWTSMLDLVETALKQAHIKYRRLDGQMSLLARDKGVKDFNTNPEVCSLALFLHRSVWYCDSKPSSVCIFQVTVMIMSLKAGNLGLNMVAACHVVLLDLWWNPTTEDQAVDRAHRIGQTRPVTVTRLTVKDTVEDRILALQVPFPPIFELQQKDYAEKSISVEFLSVHGSFFKYAILKSRRYIQNKMVFFSSCKEMITKHQVRVKKRTFSDFVRSSIQKIVRRFRVAICLPKGTTLIFAQNLFIFSLHFSIIIANSLFN